MSSSFNPENDPTANQTSITRCCNLHNISNKFKNSLIHARNSLNFRFFNKENSSNEPARVYQVWPGKNVFFFHGRIMFGPDPRGFLLTSTSILISDWILCSYIDDIPPRHSTLIFTLSSLLTLLTIINLVLASTRDPGIIPRSKEILPSTSALRRSKSRRININGVEVKLKYCQICMIFRPPRTCHCSTCDNCVEKFDHHCPWIGQCIGLRNYRYYMMLLLSALIFFAYMFALSWWRIKKKASEVDNWFFKVIVDIPENFGLLIFSFLAIWFVGGLLVFHFYLLLVNQTAHENYKRRYVQSRNPYDKGALRNIKEALFTTLPPPRVNFRATVGFEGNLTTRRSGLSSNSEHEEVHVGDEALDQA